MSINILVQQFSWWESFTQKNEVTFMFTFETIQIQIMMMMQL